MDVLVAYATKHGATRGIAERIAAVLRDRGFGILLRDVQEAGDIFGFDAFVIGSAVYLGKWRKEAVDFVRANSATLSRRPTWLFSSGPLGPVGTDPERRVERDVMEARELDELRDALSLESAARPREHRVFFGAIDPGTLGAAERLMRVIPAGRHLLPEGDFRDWSEIESWATSIADQLSIVPVPG